MKLKKNSLLYNDKFRISLEAGILFVILVLLLTVVFLKQCNNTNDDKAQKNAQTIYDNLTETLAKESSSVVADTKVLSLSFDNDSHKLYATGYVDSTLIDFNMITTSNSLESYLPNMLEADFQALSTLQCSKLTINSSASFTTPDGIDSLAYKVATYGEVSRISATYYQSNDDSYASVYRRTYDTVENTWSTDGVLSSSTKENNETLYELYKLILNS